MKIPVNRENLKASLLHVSSQSHVLKFWIIIAKNTKMEERWYNQ